MTDHAPSNPNPALQEALGGRYVIERELGRGGMGVVYLVWERALDRMVALKILPPRLATDRRRERFLREARVAANLEHDHIVPIYTVDEAGAFAYYTMKHVAGRTLAQRIVEEGALEMGDALRILRDVARAVHYAHGQGVVHRDLKPGNILLDDATGRAYVTDFGIARVMAESAPAGGGTFGTPAYVSPEQVTGSPADRRSDIYSLGVIAFVMATGKPLFTGTPRQIMEQHLRQPAPALDAVGRHLDVTLSRAVRRCLAKDPAERFQTADELARTLDLAPELATDLAPRPREFVSALRLVSRSTPVAVLLGVVAADVAWQASQGGAWGTASAALGVLALLVASPLVGALPATRRFLKRGYGREDILHAIERERDRERERLARSEGRATDRGDRVWRLVAAGGGGLVGLGVLSALAGIDLPANMTFWSMAAGTALALAGGVGLVWRERQRNRIWGGRWLTFWSSRFGKWTVKLAGLGLGPVPLEPELPPPEPAALALPTEASSRLPGGVDPLDDVVRRTSSYARQVRAFLKAASAERTREGRAPTPQEIERDDTLERQLALLEELLARFDSADADALDSGSLTADLEAARDVCAMLEGLIEMREWRA